ncbi:MAG: AraC family transcriptional regulator [Pseudomonadota bacterium]
MIFREIEPGLSLAAMDETFADDVHLRETAKESLFYGVQTGGGNHAIRVDEQPRQEIRTGQSFLLSFGEEGQCETHIKKGSRRAFVGVRLDGTYVKRLVAERGEAGVVHLIDRLQSPARARIYPPKVAISQLAGAVLKNGYAGAAADLFYESSALAFVANLLSLGNVATCQPRAPSRLSVRRAHKTKQLIDEKVHAPLTVQELARAIGINATTLRQDFLATHGKTIFTYGQETRMRYAHELLTRNELNVSQVAFAIGFADVSSFSTAFRRYFGYAPSLVRK